MAVDNGLYGEARGVRDKILKIEPDFSLWPEKG